MQKSLSRTDTWTVEALQDIDELIESATHEGPIEVRSINVNRETPATEAFTVNVDRILKRIADLEADIVTGAGCERGPARSATRRCRRSAISTRRESMR